MNRINYQIEMERLIKKEQNCKPERIPTLLLHSCCAPCSSYVLEYLSKYFEITVFYYNPNIYPEREWEKRTQEQKRLISDMNGKNYPIHYLEGPYERERFYEMAQGLEHVPEGGERCMHCYELRLRETAKLASAQGFDYFTTTLSISPLKNAQKLNEIGKMLEETYQIPYLFSDFKKKNGYIRSVELSQRYGLYRQDYCGCEFSYKESLKRNKSYNLEQKSN